MRRVEYTGNGPPETPFRPKIFLDILGYFVCARFCARDFVRAILCARYFVRARPWESVRPKTRKSPNIYLQIPDLKNKYMERSASMPALEYAQ